jgi:hypothetical protein
VLCQAIADNRVTSLQVEGLGGGEQGSADDLVRVEEVRVSDRLYDDDDRRLIMKGIALILIYLQKGTSR